MLKKFDAEIQYFATAFIDLLGQRAKLRRLTALPASPEDPRTHEVRKLIYETIGVVRDLRDAYVGFLDTFGEVSEEIKALPSPIREQIIEARKFDVKMVGLGDAVALSVGLGGSNTYVQATNGVLAVLMSTCGIVIFSLAAGRPLRGGIDVGIGGLVEDNEAYGAGVLRAVELESRKAESPRIAVGGELNNYLNAIVAMPVNSKLDEIAVVYAKQATRLLFVDLDGQLCLDFMGAQVLESLGQAIDPSEITKANHWVQAELEQLRKRGDQKLIRRYESLYRYVESRKHYWPGA